MANVIVDAEALNLRSSPGIKPDNLIGKLYLGQPIEHLGESDEPGWLQCRAVVDGTSWKGFVSSDYVRPLLQGNREALVESVHREWIRFDRGIGLEYEPPYSGYVHEMWSAIGMSHLTGEDRGWPWSAAAISFMVRNAGPAYQGFRFSASHSVYVHDAIKARHAQDASKPFWGYRLHEERPEVGDIV